MNATKRKLAEGELVLCMSIRQARSLDVVMVAAASGFDCMYVDLEHSPLSLETASMLCAGSPALGITPLVRVPSHAHDAISRALDGGAQGLLVPHVNSADEARAVVRAARFPPIGKRSVMGPSPALAYRGMPLAEINDTLNRDTLMIVMIETPEAVERADEIAAVDGVDMLLIGSNDLCTEMGIPGQLRDPRLRQAYERVAAACRAHGRHLGVGGVRGDPELQRELLALGSRVIIGGSDMSYLAAATAADVRTLRTLVP
jgi:2-keto-3-deoxy-L-rhamnonate aldolase RhmA